MINDLNSLTTIKRACEVQVQNAQAGTADYLEINK